MRVVLFKKKLCELFSSIHYNRHIDNKKLEVMCLV